MKIKIFYFGIGGRGDRDAVADCQYPRTRIYITRRNLVPVDKLASRTERLRVGLTPVYQRNVWKETEPGPWQTGHVDLNCEDKAIGQIRNDKF
jgi:hypothetical protein